MSAINKDFDEIIAEHEATLTTGRKIMLEVLLNEMETYGYTTFSELHGAVLSHLELIDGECNE